MFDMQRREANKRDKERRLLEAAKRLFRTQGYEATTMRQVAEAAGIGLGTVYSYARDKTHLLDLISKDDLAAVQSQVFATLPHHKGVHAQLMHVFAGIYAHHGKDLATSRALFKELSFGGDAQAAERAARMTGLVTNIATIYEAAQKRKRLGSHFVPMEAALHAFALHFFFLIVWMSGTAGLDEQTALAQLDRALALQLRGLKGERT